MQRAFLLLLILTAGVVQNLWAAEVAEIEYNRDIAPLFQKYCNGCHNAQEPDGELTLQNFKGLMRGGANGAVVVPGQPDKSRLILVLEKQAEPFMPPEGEKAPSKAEVALLRAWVKAGAHAPAGGDPAMKSLVTPKIAPVGEVRRPVHAVAYAPEDAVFAAARHQVVEIYGPQGDQPIQQLSGLTGQVNDVGFSKDGTLLFAAAGEPGLFGEVTLWKTADWSKVKTIRGHSDSLYAADMSPDGKILATGGYDQTIILWDVKTAEPLRDLTGHNGPVFDVGFSPSGTVLASASGDRTIKLWDVASGTRLDTLGQPEEDQYTVAFSPNGRDLVAGGVDHRVRVWRISDSAREGTNRLLYARFAHESAILKLVFSHDGRTLITAGEDRAVKLWETGQFTQFRALQVQPDWPAALAVTPDDRQLLVGRLDGTLAAFSLEHSAAQEPALSEPISEAVLLSEATIPTGTAKLQEFSESEPNDSAETATPLQLPAAVTGVLQPGEGDSEDVDFFRFNAKQGQSWIIETAAARLQSPVDTKIDVLNSDGTPTVRYLLRAVRESYITFRPIDSSQNQVRVKNWEEMQLNQFLYMGGEVCKLFRMPQGPDSGFVFYTINGKRRNYFDTSATVHAKEDPVYIVEPYLPGSRFTDNGLPVFPLYFSNDDDGDRKLGSDSRLTFTAPADGTYLVRVADVRGFGGKNYHYQLTIRPPQPDFSVTLEGKGATIPPGSGQRLTVKLDRRDNFQGPVRVEITGMPPGFAVTSPIDVEAGHLEAQGVINAAADSAAPDQAAWENVKLTASATIGGKTVRKELGNLGEMKLGEKPKVVAHLVHDTDEGQHAGNELVIAPGETITAKIRIERSGFDGELKFEVDNLPHGVIVDNIGLNGIMVRQGETERQIFLTAADWVQESARQIYAVGLGEGKPASRPMLLRVKLPNDLARRP